MNSMLKSIKKHIKLEYFFLMIIVCEVLFLMYMNTMKCSAYPELDMAKLYRHAIEMVRNGSIVIDGWNYISTMELDCALLLALPVYAVTRNIYISFGIANIIFVFVYIYIFYDILTKLQVKTVYKYISVILLLIPYRMGMLEYLNMMFYNGGQYVIKVLVPLIFIDLILEKTKNQWTVKNIVLTVCFALLMIITSISSGSYVLMSGILPVAVGYILNVVLSGSLKNIDKNKVILFIIALMTFALGNIMCKLLNVSPNSEGMDLVAPSELVNSIFVTIWGYLSVFAVNISPGVISITGIVQLLRYAVAFCIAIIIIYDIKSIFVIGEENDKQRILTMPVIITTIILCLTHVCFSDVYYPERYFFIGLVPSFLTVPYFLENCERVVPNRLTRNSLFLIMSIMVALLIPVSILDVRNEIRNGYEGGYKGVYDALDYAKENNIGNVFWLYNLPDGEVARMFEPDIKSTVINFTDNGAILDEARDFYYAANDAAYYHGSNLLLEKAGAGDFERMPEYIQASYSEIGIIGGYTAYISDTNKFDNYAGYPLDGERTSKDFCYTEGYQVFGDIDLYGYLGVEGNGTCSLISPLFTAGKADVEAKLIYDSDEIKTATIGSLVLMDENYNVIAKEELTAKENEVSIKVASGNVNHIGVIVDEGIKVRIHELQYSLLN